MLRLAINRKSTVAFTVDIQHVHDLANTFRRKGIDARMVSSLTAQSDRLEIIEAFRKEEFAVLVNCGILTEGTDIPNIDCILLARPTQSGPLLQQMIGRGMRTWPGKKNCLIIDFVDNIEGRGAQEMICTVPTLFGLGSQDEVYFKESGVKIRNANGQEELSFVKDTLEAGTSEK